MWDQSGTKSVNYISDRRNPRQDGLQRYISHLRRPYAIQNTSDGIPSNGTLLRGSNGAIYGTAIGGAAGFGLVYKLSGSTFTVLHAFSGTDRSNPEFNLIRDSSGNFYGTTLDGGANNQGVIYKLDPSGNETVLYSFTGGSDGGGPQAGVVRDEAGNLYGSVGYGGVNNNGVVFKLDSLGNYTVLHSLAGSGFFV